MMAVRAGAERVVTTDYPDEELIVNIRKNVDTVLQTGERERMLAVGYLWGSDEGPLIDANKGRRFDMIFMCDVIFNHSEHCALLRTIDRCLRRDSQGIVWCVFSHYRPLIKDRDLEMLRLAESEFEFVVDKIGEARYDDLVVECKRGDPEDTKMVYAYTIKRRS